MLYTETAGWPVTAATRAYNCWRSFSTAVVFMTVVRQAGDPTLIVRLQQVWELKLTDREDWPHLLAYFNARRT